MSADASQPTLSVVTVCFNSAGTIRDSIESVLAQSYAAIEYIVVDGGSNDQTMDILREYDSRIDVVISESDRGIYDAMNKGIAAASGDVVGFLNSDDFYSSDNAVASLMECMQRTDSDTVFADLVYVNADDSGRVLRYYNSGNFHPRRLRYGWMPAHPTFLVKRELYEKYGGYSLDYRVAADFDMVARLLHVAGASYSYLPEVVIKMRIGGASTSGIGGVLQHNREIVRACRANGIDTNLARVMLKIPAKLMEYIRRP